MADKHIPGLKKEEKPSGDGQPDESSKVNPDDINVDEKDIDINVEKTDDEKVVLSKEDYQKIQEDRKNYRKGLLSVKGKLKATKKKPEKKEKPKKKESDYLSKEEFYNSLEKEAIAKATDDKFVDKNWVNIMEYYTPRYGNDSVQSILKNIEDAVFLYEKRTGNKRKEKDTDKESRRFLSREKGLSSGDKSGGSKDTSKKKGKGGLLKRGKPAKDWYSDEESK